MFNCVQSSNASQSYEHKINKTKIGGVHPGEGTPHQFNKMARH